MEKARQSGKQYQVSLSKNLHMDIPGMPEALMSSAASAGMALTVGFMKIIFEMKKQQLLEEAKKD
jgi:hypothetical protein